MHILGKRMKYSCSLWSDGIQSLDQAEESMLDLTCRRAGIQDGMNVLELGCGWGSLTSLDGGTVSHGENNCRIKLQSPA